MKAATSFIDCINPMSLRQYKGEITFICIAILGNLRSNDFCA